MLDLKHWVDWLNFYAKRGDVGGIRASLAYSDSDLSLDETSDEHFSDGEIYVVRLRRWAILTKAAEKAARRNHPVAAGYLRERAGERPQQPPPTLVDRLGELTRVAYNEGLIRNLATAASGEIGSSMGTVPSLPSAHFLFDVGERAARRRKLMGIVV